MRIPDSLESLVSEGIITEVVRPLMSGKEAQVYLVESGGELRVAKIYKDANHRSFKHRAEYTEGRGTRSSRDARAMQKRSKYGRAMDEEAWRSAEVDVIYRLRTAGVRVPEPFQFVDGVLIMELVKDAYGEPAPRLGDVDLGPAEARRVFDQLLREAVRMLCADVVHGDLSPFNVLLDANGPVIIDFPQSVDASKNQTARSLLVRDVDNLTHFLSRYEPAMRNRPYGQELWAAYERNELTPDTVLTGDWRPAHREVNTFAMLDELAEVERDEIRRRQSKGLAPLGKKGAAPNPRPPFAAGPNPAGRGHGPRSGEPRDQSRPRSDHAGPRQHGAGQRGGAPSRDAARGGAQDAVRTGGAQDAARRGGAHDARGGGPRDQARTHGSRDGGRGSRPQGQRAPLVERGRVSSQAAGRGPSPAQGAGVEPRRDGRPRFNAEAQQQQEPRRDEARGDAPPAGRRRRRRRRGGGGASTAGNPPRAWTPS